MILLIIYIILFLIFLKINKNNNKNNNKNDNKNDNKSKIIKKESFYNLKNRIKNCSNCRCKYYDNNQANTYRNLEMSLLTELEDSELEEGECELEEGECELEEGEMLPGQREYEESIEKSDIVNNPISAQNGQNECELCFPAEPGEPSNAMSYNIICANPERLRACNCGVKGLCSPCQEDFDRAHIYALQNMCTNRGYIWKYSSGSSGRTRGYVWDCLHTKETCIKESLKILKHPDMDPTNKTADLYYEWDNIAGVCTYASPYLRNICEGENKFWYDARGEIKSSHKCHLTPDYCTKYAQDAFKQHDCFIYFGQAVAEALSTTIGVRCGRLNCDVTGCPLHHPPGYGKDDIDIRNPEYGKLNCDWIVKHANCSREFMWDMYGPSRKLTENASDLIPYNNEYSVCNGKKEILSDEQKNERCKM